MSTTSLYVLLPGFVVCRIFRSRLKVLHPISLRKMGIIMSLLIQFAAANQSNHLVYELSTALYSFGVITVSFPLVHSSPLSWLCRHTLWLALGQESPEENRGNVFFLRCKQHASIQTSPSPLFVMSSTVYLSTLQ